MNYANEMPQKRKKVAAGTKESGSDMQNSTLLGQNCQ